MSLIIFSHNKNSIFIQYSLIMKAFDIGQLKKTARVKQLEVNRSYSQIHKSPLRSSVQQSISPPESFYLTRWGRSFDGKEQNSWVNVGQGILAVAIGEEHALILNNKSQCYGYGNNSYGQLGQQGQTISKPSSIHSLKDMKITGIFCGAYHSFIMNAKSQLYAFGYNLKGQLGLGHNEDKKKPMLVYSLLPGGLKNPKSNFCVDTFSQGRRKQHRKSKQDLPELANITNLMGYSPLISKGSEDQKPIFLLANDEMVVKVACGPLHSVVLTSKSRMFSSGYGQKFALGTGRNRSSSQFTQIRLKSTGKIDKIQVGNSSTGYISGGRAWIVGTIGQKVHQNFTSVYGEDAIDIKICQRNAIILTKKWQVYQLGQICKDGQKYSTDNPKKIEKMHPIRQIWAGANYFFGLADKCLYGWGDNTNGQISNILQKKVISTPQSLKINSSYLDNIQIISGNCTTFFLSGQKLQNPVNSNQQSTGKGRGLSNRNGSNLCGPQEKQLLNELGVQPRVFNCNMEIDIKQLDFGQKISEGGYGIIYKGLWRQTIVAIKVFKIQSESAIRDFFSECAAMQALRHPNIVMFLGACTKAPDFAIVLQYCSRGSLWSNIQNLQLNLGWQQRKRMALQTARGVHYLHSCNPPVLHRDLKSLNLLLDQSGRVKLADFGWTKGLDNYMTGKIGTYQWMAPEVIASQKYSQKADVFSYGIILWEIASRQPPFKHLTGLQVSIEVYNNDLRPPIPKKTPQAFAKLIRKCWDRQASKRPSFKQIIRELQAMKF